jgi:hypothetical protein
MKPTVAKIERFIEREEVRLGITKVVPSPWIRLLADIGQTSQGVIDAHLREHPHDAGHNFLVDVIIEPRPRSR